MTDDIVTNLRKIETVGEPLMPWHVTPQQAADEIEHLRTDIKKWRDIADNLARFGNCESPDCPDCDRDWKLTYKIYEQAVRGE